VNSTSGIWGRIPAKIELDAFSVEKLAFGENNFSDVHDELY